eukprot:TRINITY_DN14731_c0_g1_i1.p1 TRINITY_DN14731_c0_g1~~TRINITY_DN14731_c0_g1_i1.p1  ORF type:complete len:531 (-),score=83.47 TRINITY_DN14731_c0_g1_i1:128-1720(-)
MAALAMTASTGDSLRTSSERRGHRNRQSSEDSQDEWGYPMSPLFGPSSCPSDIGIEMERKSAEAQQRYKKGFRFSVEGIHMVGESDTKVGRGDRVYYDKNGHSLVTSHPLPSDELSALCKCRGYVPPIKVEPCEKVSLDEIESHILELDESLRQRVQGIVDRFHARTVRRKRYLCTLQPFAGIGKFLRLGVIQEIWVEIIFYVLYTLVIQFYAYSCDWEIMWTLKNQDSLYYPAIVLSFLLSFRASDCMARYQAGNFYCFEMEKSLREMAFEVMTKLALDDEDVDHSQATDEKQEKWRASLKKRYFKHEFRRLCSLLFVCAARDLNDSALDDFESSPQCDNQLPVVATRVEHASMKVTHSMHGHAFRVNLISAWLRRIIQQIHMHKLFDQPNVFERSNALLKDFNSAWYGARQVAFSKMPESIMHLMWLLTNAINLVLPLELVSVCKWLTWIPSLMLTISFFGIVQISNCLENPFGFDDDDIALWQIAENLDEDICLIMYYAALDEVGGENLARNAMGAESIYCSGQYCR